MSKRIEFIMTSLLKDSYTMTSYCLVGMINTCAEAKYEQMLVRIEPKPPPKVQKYEPPHRKKIKKSNVYEI